MTNLSAEKLVSLLNLKPHPEGGYFCETYKSQDVISKDALPKRFNGERACSTAIYFLLPAGSKSHLHKIKSDETWHFYLGGSLTLVQIHPDGKVEEVVIGPDLVKGEYLQYTVKAGVWFGAYPKQGSAYSLVGCTVSPGFDFADFEMGNRESLLQEFPGAKAVIEILTSRSLRHL